MNSWSSGSCSSPRSSSAPHSDFDGNVEAHLSENRDDLYEERLIGHGNVGLFATKDIEKGTLLFREAPFVKNALDAESFEREIAENV